MERQCKESLNAGLDTLSATEKEKQWIDFEDQKPEKATDDRCNMPLLCWSTGKTSEVSGFWRDMEDMVCFIKPARLWSTKEWSKMNRQKGEKVLTWINRSVAKEFFSGVGSWSWWELGMIHYPMQEFGAWIQQKEVNEKAEKSADSKAHYSLQSSSGWYGPIYWNIVSRCRGCKEGKGRKRQIRMWMSKYTDIKSAEEAYKQIIIFSASGLEQIKERTEIPAVRSSPTWKRRGTRSCVQDRPARPEKHRSPNFEKAWRRRKP